MLVTKLAVVDMGGGRCNIGEYILAGIGRRGGGGLAPQTGGSNCRASMKKLVAAAWAKCEPGDLVLPVDCMRFYGERPCAAECNRVAFTCYEEEGPAASAAHTRARIQRRASKFSSSPAVNCSRHLAGIGTSLTSSSSRNSDYTD